MSEYTERIAQVMGLPNMKTIFKNSPPVDGGISRGYYTSGTNKITINSWIFDNDPEYNSYDLMSTVVHELRHAYQESAVNNPEQFIVTEETLSSWQESMDNYKTSTGFQAEGMDSDKAYEAYRNQAIEKDARKFAKQY